jgi:NADPH:quinone reductase-like Zn-dependent oxidoreductase
MKAIVFDTIGPPLEVLQLREVPVPQIGDDEVLVRMVVASINPGDFLFIQSLYPDPKKPVFPQQIAGNHGAGIVEKVGRNVTVAPGTLVAFSYFNSWAEYAAVPAEWLMPLPADFPVEKAGQLVNFITAWDLLEESRVRPGQWLVLTAGNSTVATLVLQFARARNVKVISVVRRATERLDLKALGASEVIELGTLSGSVRDRIMGITENEGVHGIVDSIGGPVLGDLIRSVALGAQVIIYGGMSPDSFEVHNFDVLLNVIAIRSYAYRYFFDPPQQSDAGVLGDIARLSSHFRAPVADMHPLEEFKIAIEDTIHRSEQGKHFFHLPAPAR